MTSDLTIVFVVVGAAASVLFARGTARLDVVALLLAPLVFPF